MSTPITVHRNKRIATVDYEAGLTRADQQYIEALIAQGYEIKRKIHRKSPKGKNSGGRIRSKEFYLNNLDPTDKKEFEKKLADGMHYAKVGQWANSRLRENGTGE